ncbi:MAG: DUF6065 family protein [Chloroflexota bacterium]
MAERKPLPITAYRIHKYESLEWPIVTATAQREWMNFGQGNPYRCLPLTMANQLGWLVLNPVGFVAEWHPDDPGSPIKIEFDEALNEDDQGFLIDHFGNGILTWNLPYLFRTPPGYNLLAQGPTNWFKDGVQALAGMIETDWSDATFTMNWKITRSQHPIRFEKGEPFCMITPVRRGELERFEPKVEPLEAQPEVNQAYLYWEHKRAHLSVKNFWGRKLAATFQRKFVFKYDLSYLRGKTASGQTLISDHQTRLTLKPFNQVWQKAFYRRLNPGQKSEPTSESPTEKIEED